MSETLQSVREDVLYHLGDPNQTLWRNDEIDSYIRQGYESLVWQTLPIWTYDYVNDVAGTAVYDLPADCLKVDRVTWNDARIEQWTATRLRYGNRFYMQQQGRVIMYVLEEDGLGKIRKYLIPAVTPVADQDHYNTRVEYFRRGAQLTLATDEFDIPEWAVKYIRFFAMHQAFERKGKAQDPKMSEHFRQRWVDGVARLRHRKELSFEALVGRFDEEIRKDVKPPRPKMPWPYGREVK
jgi:hypothetical protein